MFDYKKLVKKYETEVITSLQKWIQIPSIYESESATETKPFGAGVAAALEYIATLAEEKGFNVDRCDGYCTEISFGEGDIIGIYAHCDVVPVSGKWKHEPFSATIDDGKMYGRGTSDDKGPAIAAFYALCALKDAGAIKNYQVRLVIGGNEESGSRCLQHYFEVLKKPYPKYGFTPDGDFPLIYGEKGISGYLVEQKVDFENVKEISGGVASNSVIDECYAIINNGSTLKKIASSYFKATGCEYELSELPEEEVKLTVYGKASHGSLPAKGINAALVLLRFLSIYFQNHEFDIVPSYYLDTNGTALGAFYESELLHETTYNVGILNYKDGVLKYVVNFRYPENVDVHKVIEHLNTLGIGKHILQGESKPLLIDPKSDMVQTLLNVYQTETGDYETPIVTIGGGTYAKESKNTLAFGSHFPGRDDRIHNSDETITISDLTSSMAIYAHAIDALAKI